MKQLSDIEPRMYSVDFKNRSGSLETTAVVKADSPRAALEKAFRLFPEYRRSARRGGSSRRLSTPKSTGIPGRTFVIHAKKRRPRLPKAKRGAKAKEDQQA